MNKKNPSSLILELEQETTDELGACGIAEVQKKQTNKNKTYFKISLPHRRKRASWIKRGMKTDHDVWNVGEPDTV